jgi:branched-subunit amino acid aminotransferase/4-amino-4-deoxychorismate lyase
VSQPGCYTTARVRRGRVVLPNQHAARLARDARALGLGEPKPADVAAILARLAREAFGESDGIVRLEARSDAAGRLRLVGTSRGLGADPASWSALCSGVTHPGPEGPPGIKRSHHPAVAAGRDEARRAQVDEALLFDGEGLLVEGARSSPVVVLADGRAVTPPLARGGVAGLARAIALDSDAGILEADLDRVALAAAREIVALNAVRGAHPVLRLDGRAVGDGRPGFAARYLGAVLERAAEPA